MSYKYLVIDTSNLYWRSVCSCIQKAIQVKEEDKTVSIYSSVVQDVLDRINELKKEYLYDNGKVYLCFDNPKSTLTLRQIIDEEYKSPRMNRLIPEAFWDTLKILKQVLLNYSDDFVFVQYKFCEADDLVEPIIKNTEINNQNRLLLVSADLDWSRGISDNVDWFNFKTIYNKNVFYNEYNFFPIKNNVVIYKCFRGDKSDNIETGLPYFPEETLLKIMENNDVNDFNSFRDFLHSLQRAEYISDKWKKDLKENEERLLKNFQLISFIPPNVDFAEMTIQCKQYILILRSYYKILQIPFETKMLTREEQENSFFETPEYKRVKRPYKK